MTARPRRAFAGLLLATMAGLPLLAQEPPAFRTDTQVVPIYATVKGPDGHLVTDLQENDFEVFERGVRVPLALFSNQPPPITLAVLIDGSGGFFSAEWQALLHRALMALVDRLGPHDRARIGTFSGNEIALSHHLTSDHAELARVLREEPGGAADHVRSGTQSVRRSNRSRRKQDERSCSSSPMGPTR